MKLRGSDILAALPEAVASGFAQPAEVTVNGYSIDSRTIRGGEGFFAIRGEKFDGHDFVQQVLDKGAAFVVVDRDVAVDGPCLRVTDTTAALQRVATWARRKWGRRVVGVTGSAGKTTTKDVISHLLSSRLRVGKTEGNLNNHLGVPLSVLRLDDDCEVAVLEMAMNHAEEIRTLARIAQPEIGVVTNVGYAHAENFADGIEGIALAKRELIEELPADGVAVLNADDERVRRFAEIHPGRSILFGTVPEANVRATDIEIDERGTRFQVDGTRIESELQGMHNVRNILAGMAVGSVLGIAPEELAAQARTLRPGRMRGERLQHNGIEVLNDCYNSNPEAARAMLEALRGIPARRHLAVLGEMLELGRWSEPKHREVGTFAAKLGIHVLVGIRGAARYMVDAAIEAGLSENAAYFFSEPAEAGEHLRALAQPGDAILFKGSRGTRVELALERFLA
jgi:UDP-N-acetylmuramoyl-tripeptide--D-alanyl-D-alanine ligase